MVAGAAGAGIGIMNADAGAAVGSRGGSVAIVASVQGGAVVAVGVSVVARVSVSAAWRWGQSRWISHWHQ